MEKPNKQSNVASLTAMKSALQADTPPKSDYQQQNTELQTTENATTLQAGQRKTASISQPDQLISALHAVTETASSSLDLDAVLWEVIKEITDVFRFDTTRIFLFNPEMSELHLRASYETKRGNFAPNKVFRRGEGNIGRVAESGEPLIYENVHNDLRYGKLSSTNNTKQAGFSFLAAFPIKTKIRTAGTILCIGLNPRRLNASEIQLITSMGNQIALTVEYAKLFEEAQTKAKELSALYSVSEIASQSLDIELALSRTLHTVLEIFGFDAGRIYIRHKQNEELRLITHFGYPEGIQPTVSYQAGEGAIGKIYQTNTPHTFANMQTDPEFQRIARRNRMPDGRFRAAFFVPIQIRGECVGVMQVLSKNEHHFFQSETRVINAIAYHLGVAVENAELFQELREKNTQLQKANKGKSECLGVVTHELRTPVSTILGYSALIKDQRIGEINQDQEKALTVISRQGEELLRLINNILQATRIEAEATRAEILEFNLIDCLTRLRAKFGVSLGKEVNLTWDYPADLPLVKTDGEKLEHILQNLIGNAIKYTDRGNVTISALCPPGTETVIFKVADTGIGIEKELLSEVFEMFRQDRSSVSEQRGGVGLGLYIAKKFADLIGATIEVETEPGNGSTFTVKLPLT